MQTGRTMRGDETAALERSVAAALRTIAAVQAERSAPPVRSARLRLATIYGVTRLQKRRERDAAQA
ncbi:hypothetical protein DK419_28090 [Methylobacterium terrae]|uniref:Uncharacterized protein n=1 Tax=Methylobacterium terrae TaxID=2202827 RepID=A0A2U8WUE3_9HYPH|nr:hypothetical protein [Methylobacterium terrae]AWN49717.1 hypothetical protein DK419_28090 [Methylobacterium terrae]